MKKFRFALETVLSYKQQMLDALLAEHGEILLQVRRQEELLEELWQSYYAYSEEYSARCADGMSITDVMAYQTGLRAREREIHQETEYLEKLRRQEEAKREEVVASKQDTSSIEKLREKQMKTYQAAVAKSEEVFVEEFVASQRSIRSSAFA